MVTGCGRGIGKAIALNLAAAGANIILNDIDTDAVNTVFGRLNGTPLKRFDSAWRRICKIASIDDFHYHDLRHTFCSNLLLSGSDLKDVKEMIGHSDIAMTDRYSHITNLHKYYRQNKLAEHYANGNNQVGYT